MYPTWTADPVGDYMHYDAWRAAEAREETVCSVCGEPIEGETDYLDGLPVCAWCMARYEREAEGAEGK